MILFSVLFFGIMIDAGLFDPLISRILRLIKNDPFKITVGTAVMTLLLALDGDGVTTFIIVTSALLPIYIKVGMNPVILTGIAGLANYHMNSSPWGGPTTRTMAVLDVGVSELFVPMIPSLMVGVIFILGMSCFLGIKERKRLGYDKDRLANSKGDDKTSKSEIVNKELAIALEGIQPDLKREKLIWVNLFLLVLVMVSLVKEWLPPSVLFIVAFIVAILINYPRFNEMEERIKAHSGNALWATLMIFTAGIFTGIFKGTKMIEAMATSLVSIIPDAMGSHIAVIIPIFSNIFTLVMSPDAFYFGILPVLSEMAVNFGIEPVEIGRAALLGQSGYGLSPFVASILLLTAIAKVDFFEHQKFAFKWGIGLTIVMTITALVTGIIPL
jgi:CitMHS family citrate-Mg2+:H+ or citrate-Ca2+:H+ symporter